MQHDPSFGDDRPGTTFQSEDSIAWIGPTRCPTCDWGFEPEDPVERAKPRTRRTDPMRPPSVPTDVECLHCGQTTSSEAMHWAPETAEGRRRRVLLEEKDAGLACSGCGWTPRPPHPGDEHGHWLCGTPGCDGAGFGFDLHPVDPAYVDPDGREMGRWIEDDEEWDEDDDLLAPGAPDAAGGPGPGPSAVRCDDDDPIPF